METNAGLWEVLDYRMELHHVSISKFSIKILGFISPPPTYNKRKSKIIQIITSSPDDKMVTGLSWNLWGNLAASVCFSCSAPTGELKHYTVSIEMNRICTVTLGPPELNKETPQLTQMSLKSYMNRVS